MKTISNHEEINELLIFIEGKAVKAINAGLSFTVEHRDNGITESQFNAMHVWIRKCVQYLNEKKLYRCAPVSGRMIEWSEEAFKDDVYKVVLKAMSNKVSTKDQNTIDPTDVVLCISGHMSTGYEENVCLPEWPSNR